MKLNKLFLTFIVPVLTLSVSCQSTDGQSKDYFDYNDRHILVDDFFNQNEDDYAVYIYRESCGTCQDVKSKVFDYIDRHGQGDKKPYVPIYFLRYKKAHELYVGENNDVLDHLSRFDDSPYKDESGDVPPSRYVDIMSELKTVNIGVTDVKDVKYYFTPTLYVVKSDNNQKSVVDVVVESEAVGDWIDGRRE